MLTKFNAFQLMVLGEIGVRVLIAQQIVVEENVDKYESVIIHFRVMKERHARVLVFRVKIVICINVHQVCARYDLDLKLQSVN